MIALISAAIGVVKSIAQSTRGDGALGAVLSSINGKLDIAITRLASIQSSLEFLIGQVASLREELFEALGQQYTYQLHNEVVAAIRKVRNIYKETSIHGISLTASNPDRPALLDDLKLA
jgi:hypothetical protein